MFSDLILDGNVSAEQMREQLSPKALTKLVPCITCNPFFFSSEIPEWLQVYAKASPEYDCFLKVTILHYICEGVSICMFTYYFSVTLGLIHYINYCNLHVSLHAICAFY